jgi:anti-anti-sigma regulatory factor
VVVHLGAVTLADSAIFNVLLRASDDADRSNGSMRLVLVPHTRPRRVADLLHVPPQLAGYATLQEALASFSERRADRPQLRRLLHLWPVSLSRLPH